MFAEIFLSLGVAAAMTFIGSWWIDRLYRTSEELTFPENIFERSKFRRPILFCALSVSNWYILTTINAPEKFFLIAAIFLLVLMTMTDFEQYMLFDAMTLPLAIIGALLVWQMGLDVRDHVLAAAIGGGIFLLLAIIFKSSIGYGDVKLITALGLLFGCEKLLAVVLTATICGGIAALLMLLTKQKDRKSYFAYGPYFAVAAIYALLSR